MIASEYVAHAHVDQIWGCLGWFHSPYPIDDLLVGSNQGQVAQMASLLSCHRLAIRHCEVDRTEEPGRGVLEQSSLTLKQRHLLGLQLWVTISKPCPRDPAIHPEVLPRVRSPRLITLSADLVEEQVDRLYPKTLPRLWEPGALD